MNVKQIYSIINLVNKQVTGVSDIVVTDLTGLISLGNDVLTSTTTTNEWLGVLMDRIGKTIASNRMYELGLSRYSIDSFEFGCAVQKTYVEMFDAKENEAYGQTDGDTVDKYVINKPKVKQKIFSNRTTWEIDFTIHDFILKQAFLNETDMATFLNSIYIAVENSFNIKAEGMSNMMICNFIGQTLLDNSLNNGRLTVVNLLTDYNTKFTKTLTQAQALVDPTFLKYASSEIKKRVERLPKMSRLFNTEQYDRHTSKENMILSVHSDFASNVETYLESETYHNDLVSLPLYGTVPYWQGTGNSFEFDDTSKINIKVSSGTEVAQDGIVALLTDKDALGVFHEKKKQLSSYNEKGEYTNNYKKMESGYFNDMSENGIVFIVSSSTFGV